ncbi:hypothetical protein LTR08_002177 [Meristemomyces frigidus]|nr:hypothetical protein LTR08_002177 [Meristemomyces frigidus]
MSHPPTIQDRTPEFRSILAHAHKALARQRRPGAPPQTQPLLPPTTTPPTRQQRSEFARNAAAIGRGIAGTMGKLQRLGELAKRKTLFDDRPVEIAELTYVIKQDLAALNQNISALQHLQRQQGLTSSTSASPAAGSGREEGEHNKNVVVLLQDRLAGVTVGFKEVLEVRTRNMRASRERQDNFVSAVGAQHQTPGQPNQALASARTDSPLYNTTPNRGRSPHPPGSASPQPQHQHQQNDVLSLDPFTSSTSALYTTNPPSTNQLLLLEENAPNHSTYLTTRTEAISAIESTIADLGSIFGQLATMVSEQAEQIQRIDANTDDVVDNVDGAQRELMKYWGRVQGNRWLVAKLMGVLMVFFLVWVLVAG